MSACISKRVSLVLRLFDDYDLKTIENGVNIYLNGYNLKPIRKAGGYLVFTNLENDVYKIEIKSESYLTENFTVNLKDLDNLNPVINIRLKPNPKSFFKEDGVVIRFKVFDKNEMPVKNGQIKGVLYTKDYFVGQVKNEKISISDKNIFIDEFYEDFFSGDSLYIESVRKEKCEFITIYNKVDKGSYSVNEPIKNTHKRGEKLRKAIITRTDSEGNGVVYFKSLLTNKNKIKIIITSSEDIKEVVMDVEEAQVNLGKISI